ncbi:rCG21115, partial [Rattus norvegicus]
MEPGTSWSLCAEGPVEIA